MSDGPFHIPLTWTVLEGQSGHQKEMRPIPDKQNQRRPPGVTDQPKPQRHAALKVGARDP
jgi:hypothetical protein